MNADVNKILGAIRLQLEGAAMQRAPKMEMKCEGCGCEMSADEAKDMGDGEMLCEECWAEMSDMAGAEETEEAVEVEGGEMAEAGAKFKKLVKAFKKRGDIEDPAALAAFIGRKKYGAKKFAKMAAAGRKHSK